MLTIDDRTQTSTIRAVSPAANDRTQTAESLVLLLQSSCSESNPIGITSLYQPLDMIGDQQPIELAPKRDYQCESRPTIAPYIIATTTIRRHSAYLLMMMELMNTNSNSISDPPRDESSDSKYHLVDLALASDLSGTEEIAGLLSGTLKSPHDQTQHQPQLAAPEGSMSSPFGHTCVCVHCATPLSSPHPLADLPDDMSAEGPISDNQLNPHPIWSTDPWQDNIATRPTQPPPQTVIHRRRINSGSGSCQATKKCSNCGSTTTPSWRRCPEGKALLCNACGLYQKLHKRPRPVIIDEEGNVRMARDRIPSHLKANIEPDSNGDRNSGPSAADFLAELQAINYEARNRVIQDLPLD